MNNFKKINLYLIVTVLATVVSIEIYSCTGIFLHTNDDSYIYARTLEFGIDIESEILFIPRDYNYKALAPNGKPDGLEWNTKFAAIGANAYHTNHFVDGLNEEGLAGGLFYFPGFAKYQEVSEENYSKSLPMWQLLTWILTNFAKVDEVKDGLNKIYVSDAEFPQFKSSVPAHLIIHDNSGKSLVIEYFDGKLHVFDNPLGVITNSPNFDWHLTNIRNYINLEALNAKPKTFNGVEFAQLGQGSGMLGLPGDFTPPSRFIRAVEFTQNAEKVNTAQEGIYQAFHILNNFDIPKNSVTDEKGVSELTSWTSASDIKNKVFYFRTYNNFQLAKVALDQFDLNAKEPKTLPMKYEDTIFEVKAK